VAGLAIPINSFLSEARASQPAQGRACLRFSLFWPILSGLKVFQLTGGAGLAIPINSFLGEVRAGALRVRPI